jgi:hypothetical protein
MQTVCDSVDIQCPPGTAHPFTDGIARITLRSSPLLSVAVSGTLSFVHFFGAQRNGQLGWSAGFDFGRFSLLLSLQNEKVRHASSLLSIVLSSNPEFIPTQVGSAQRMDNKAGFRPFYSKI